MDTRTHHSRFNFSHWVLAGLVTSFPAGVASAAPGELDGTFGNAGRVQLQFGDPINNPIDAELDAAAQQADGKLVAVGRIQDPSDYRYHFLVVRFNVDGTLDTSFDSDGWTSIDVGGLDWEDHAYAVLVQPDGKIVAAGQTTINTPSYNADIAIVRLNSDGSPDATFGTSGRVRFDAGGTNGDRASGIVRRASDGRLIVAGTTDRNVDEDILFAAFTLSGAPDTTFGTDGVTLVDFGPGSTESANALVQQPDGALVAAGVGPGSSVQTMVAVRVTEDGDLDTTFDGDGKVVVAFGLFNAEATGLALQTGGEIVLAGYADTGDGRQTALARITSAGALDNTLGGTGTVINDLGADWSYETLAGVAVQADGKLVIGGSLYNQTFGNVDLYVARLESNGSIDTAFGNQGVGLADFGRRGQLSYVQQPNFFLRQADGRLVVGSRDGAGPVDLARFDSTGGGSGGVLSFVNTFSSADETAVSVTVTLRRSGGATGAVSANVRLGTANGYATAANGCDFTVGATTVSWPDGDYSDKQITVTILDDSYIESGDLLELELYGATGAALAVDAHQISIFDNADSVEPVAGTLSIEQTGTVGEGAGNVTLLVTRSNGSESCVVVAYQTYDGFGQFPAAAGSDYTGSAGLVQFGEGDAVAKQISIPILNDTVGEADETFQVQLTVTGAVTIDNSTAEVTITDNDGGFPGFIWVFGGDGTDPESAGPNGGPITLQRTGGSNGEVGVSYAVTSGTATAGLDFTAVSGTVVWGPGDTSNKQIFVPIIDDILEELNETYVVTISAPTGGAELGGLTEWTQTIIDNDTLYPGQLSCTTWTSPAYENSVNAHVYVLRTNGRDGPVTVDYTTTNGTATAGEDFTTTSGTLQWANQSGCAPAPSNQCSGSPQQWIQVPISDDALAEGDETFAVTLSNPGGGAALGTPSSCTVTIFRSDSPNGTLAPVAPLNVQVSESAGSVTVSVARTGGTLGAVTIDYQTIAGTTTPDQDYTHTSGTLTWADGEGGNKTITVTILDDAIIDPSEYFYVFLDNETGGAIFNPVNNYFYVEIVDDENNPGTLIFADPVTVNESVGTAQLNVSRTGGVTGAVGVTYALVPGTAQPPGDYTAIASGTLSWAAGVGGFRTINIPITNDVASESAESFTVHFSLPTGSVLLPETDATIEITDDDDPGDIAMSSATVSVSETATTLNVTATRSTGSSGAVSVSYATANGTATAGSDYTAASGTLSWANGELGAKSALVTILDDAVEEPDETFAVNLSSPTGNARLGQASTAVTIQDNDANPGQLRFAVATGSVSEAAATVQIDVERFGGSLGPVSVQYGTTAGSALAGSDYTTTTGTLNWANGDATTHSFSIPIVNDTVHESNEETFTVTLANPGGGAALGTPSVETVTITNDDAENGILDLDVPTVSVTEGGQAVMHVTRTGGSGGAVSVDYSTFDNTAVAPGDYAAIASGTLNWAAGDTSAKTITVNTVDDAVDEKVETFYVRLSNAQGGASAGVTETAVSITDNDAGPAGTLGVNSTSFLVSESTAPVTVTVLRTGGFSGAASVNYATQDFTALAGSDYTAANGTLNWADGNDDPQQVVIAVNDDTIDEPDEAFLLVLSGVTGAALDPAADTSTVTIQDNDLPPVPGVLSVTGPPTVDENATAINFTVTRTTGADGAVSVDYATVPGTATSDVDYQARSGTLNWANGDLTSRNVNVPIVDDLIDEPHENFALTLSNPGGDATLGTASRSTAIIDNDVSGPGMLSVVANVSVFETVGNAIVAVQRIGGFDGAVSVNYATADNTALAGADYTTASGPLNWADGEGGTQLITIPILNDALPEVLENFTVNLSGAGGGATIGAGTGFVTIQDDDVPGTLAFTQTAQTVAETTASVIFQVSRTGGTRGAVSVNYATVAGSATAGSDYTTSSGTLNWADGDATNKSVTVPILDDVAVEFDETFTIELSGATNGADIGAASVATVTVQSDEIPNPGTVRMVSTTATVAESAGTVTLQVERVGGSDGAVAIDYDTLNGTATAADYTPESGTLNWADGDMANKSITIDITNDTAYEPDEAFAVTLSNPQGGVILSNPSATVTIQSEDVPIPGTLGFVVTAISVDETAGTAVLSVSRTGGSDGAVSATYATATGTATLGDFTAASGTLNWAHGDAAAKTITVPITNDTLFESDETFTVSLTGTGGGAGLGAALATVTIVSEDPPARGTLAMASATATVDETAGTVTISVNRTGGSDGAVGVGWATAPGTATAADYTEDSGTLSWADGDAAPKSITVVITDDAIFEPDEGFTVTLSGPTGGAALGAATTAVTIRSDEAPVQGTIRMAATTASVNEPDGTVTLTVERVGGSDNAVGVSYSTANGTAGAADYTATSSNLSWAHGDATTRTITVPITNDTQFEADETFTVTLSTVTGGASLGTPTTTVTIVSEDLPQRGTLAMAAPAVSMFENVGTVTVNVTRTGGSDGAVSVDYATATGSAGAADFTATSSTLNWADGDAATKSIVVPVTNDTLFEPNETFTVQLSNALGGATLGAATTTVTIVSEDAAQRGTIAMVNATATVNETAGTVTISASRSGGTDGAVTVSYSTTPGTASAADFTGTSGALSWADGEAGTKAFDVAITNDLAIEANELFAATLSNPGGGASLGAASTAVTILDDDILNNPGVIGLTTGAVAVDETAGTVTLTVTRTNGLGGVVGVSYATAGGSATEGADYSGVSGTLSWPNGNADPMTITIPITNDSAFEADETFTLTLSGASGGAGLGTSVATITVHSEDIPPDTTPDAFHFNDQTGLPVDAEVQSNLITVSGVNAPAPISITGGEYSVNGSAFTNAPGTVSIGNTVSVRLTSSHLYSTTVSAVLTIGGVSDTFSVTTKPETVVTVVRAKGGGGGSFEWVSALLMGMLLVARRRRVPPAALAALLACVGLVPAARAGDSGLYFGAGGGASSVDVDAGQVASSIESATGATVTSIKLDEQGTSYHLTAGYALAEGFAVEAAYYDFGELDGEVTALAVDPQQFANALAKVFPSNVHGPAALARVSWPFLEQWALRMRAGFMWWQSDVDAKLVTGGTGKYSASNDGGDFIWGGAISWRPTEHLEFAVEYTELNLPEAVSEVALSVTWLTDWLSR